MTAPYITTRRLRTIGRALSDRESDVLATLRRIRVATGDGLQRLHFADVTTRQARATLASMTRRRLVARLPRAVGGYAAGSEGFAYVLDVAGLRLGAPSGRRVVRPWPVGGPFLAHSLAITELFVTLSEGTLSGPTRLLEFHGEPACWRPFPAPGGGTAVLKPDAEIILADEQFEDRWFVEVDRATESRLTLTRKLSRYVDYWRSGREQAATGIFPKVLWSVPNDARYAVLIDLFGKLPVEAWPLFTAATADRATARLLGGAAV